VTSELNTPKGFAGLDDLVSEVVVNEPKPTFEGKAAGASPLPGTDPSTPPAPKSIPGWAWGVGLIVIIGVIVTINQASSPKSSVSQSASVATQPAPYNPPPPKPVEIIETTLYVLKGSDGSRIEIEGPANATAAQLNALGQSRWSPSEVIPVEDRPPIGDSLLFEDHQIRYCLSQKIRLGGWQITVEGTDHDSVNTFNTQVDDYNARCGHYKYRTGALERVRDEVEMRRTQLDVDGRLHRGPRQPEKPPTFKLASSSKQTTVNGQSHDRCAGSVEMAKCEALENQMDRETLEQKQARQQRLEDDRLKAMAEVNGKESTDLKGQ
jgi:hypothetical protein